MQVTVKQITLALLILAESSIANAVSHRSIPKQGAIPVGHDQEGEPIYKISDMIPVGTQELNVAGGTKSLEDEFPPMGMLSNCSATLVGPRVIFTASHCQRTGTRINFKHRGSGKTYPGVCTRHPQYNDRTVFNDYTLCVLDEEVPKGTQMASFNTSGHPAKGDQLILNGGGMPNFGVHFWGKGISDGMSGQDIVTCKEVVLTSGDSGGSLIRWTTDRVNGSKFVIEGVNSRAGGRCSYFNSTSAPEFKSWANTFATDKKIEICGVNKDCGSGDVEPPPPNICIDEVAVVNHLKKLLGQAEQRLEMCRAAQ